MADRVTFNPDELTVGDILDFEEVAGVSPFAAFNGGGPPSGKAVLALVWIAMRRDDPAFTLDDARQVKVSAVVPAEE